MSLIHFFMVFLVLDHLIVSSWFYRSLKIIILLRHMLLLNQSFCKRREIIIPKSCATLDQVIQIFGLDLLVLIDYLLLLAVDLDHDVLLVLVIFHDLFVPYGSCSKYWLLFAKLHILLFLKFLNVISHIVFLRLLCIFL